MSTLIHNVYLSLLMFFFVCFFFYIPQLALEKEELRIHLQASKDTQRQLTAEVNVMFQGINPK